MIRFAIPAILVLAPFWLIPTTLYVHASMTLPIFLPYLLFTHALNKVWRRHVLSRHGLDPELADECAGALVTLFVAGRVLRGRTI